MGIQKYMLKVLKSFSTAKIDSLGIALSGGSQWVISNLSSLSFQGPGGLKGGEGPQGPPGPIVSNQLLWLPHLSSHRDCKEKWLVLLDNWAARAAHSPILYSFSSAMKTAAQRMAEQSTVEWLD